MTKITLRSNYAISAGSYQDSLIMDNFPDGIYYVALRDNHKVLAVSKIIKSGITNIQEINLNSTIKVFPNPVKDKLNIMIESIPEGTTIGLFNAFGQNVYLNSSVIQKQEIDLSLLPSGIYFLKFRNSSECKTLKILKE
jgi:hypothetical protein